jgi:hypothetical protein
VNLAHRVADYLLRDSFTRPNTTTATANAAGADRGQSGDASAPAVQLPAAELAQFAGRYYSDELGVLYEITVSGSTISVKRPRGKPETLTVRDRLTLSGAVGTLRFTLGSDRRAERFVLDAGRVQNLAFVRR